MTGLYFRSAFWFALALLALAACMITADHAFAVQMAIAGSAGLLAAALTLKNADFKALAAWPTQPVRETGYYDDVIRWGMIATVFWGVVGMLVGVFIALQLAFPTLSFGLEYTTFGRLRPLHTSAVIFAFGGNALIASSFWVVQRTCRARLAALAFYGMATFEGPMMSVKSVNSLSHYTDWGIGHVHSGSLGWVGMISFATVYFLVPRLWKRERLYSLRMINWHFWCATAGIVLYISSMWVAGIMQGLM